MTLNLDFGTIITTLVAASVVGIAGLFIRITKLETRFGDFQKNFDRLESKLDTKVGRIEKRFERVDDELKEIKGDVKELRNLIVSMMVSKNNETRNKD